MPLYSQCNAERRNWFQMFIYLSQFSTIKCFLYFKVKCVTFIWPRNSFNQNTWWLHDGTGCIFHLHYFDRLTTICLLHCTSVIHTPIGCAWIIHLLLHLLGKGNSYQRKKSLYWLTVLANKSQLWGTDTVKSFCLASARTEGQGFTETWFRKSCTFDLFLGNFDPLNLHLTMFGVS